MTEAKPIASKWKDATALAVLALLILWFCQDLILNGHVPFFRDLGTYFYPLRLSVAESFKTGELPLWERRLAQGFPLLAAFQPGVFYPPHILLVFVPLFLAIRLLFIIHFIIAVVGTYSLVRYWRYSAATAMIAGLTYSLGGTVISLSNLLNHFQSAVWLPWLLLTWEHLQGVPTWRRFLAFTVVSTLQFLAGSPEFFALSLILLVFDSLRVRSDGGWPSLIRLCGLLGAAILFMAGICMVQILPTIELFLDSGRRESIPTHEAVARSLNPINLLSIFFLDRESDLGTAKGVRYLLTKESPFFITYYMGIVSFLGIFCYFYYCSWRGRLTASSLIIGFLILAFGSWTPVYPFLLHHVPLLAAFRFPEKFFFLSYGGLFFIAVRGLAYAFDLNEGRIKSTARMLGCVCLFWVGLYGAAFLGSEAIGNLIAGRSGQPIASAVNARAVASLLSNLERQALLVVASSLLIILGKTKKLQPSLVKVLLVIVVFVDLTSANKGFLFSLDPKAIVKNESENIHSSNGAYRTFYYPSRDNLHPSSLFINGRPAYPEFVALWFRNLLPNAGLFHGVEYMQEIDALGRRPYTAFLTYANGIEPEAQIRLLRAFNVDHVVSFRPLSIAGLSLSREVPEYYSWLYRIEDPVPRAYVVNRGHVENDVMRTLQRLSGSDFDPRAEVLLDREISTGPDRALDAKTEIVHYANTEVTVQTESNADGILVLLDSHYPGWKAYVDGKETAIARANHFYRAVPLPRGRHVVEFKYEPLSFKLGLFISLSTIIAVIGISLLLHFRSRRPLPRPA
jgi:hypothetical protein